MADGGWSPPLLASPLLNDEGSPITQEDIGDVLEFVYDTYDAWLNEDWPDKEQNLFSVGTLHMERVLNPLLEQGKWMSTAEYLRRVFRHHLTEAQAVRAAVPGDHQVWEIRWAHPELYMLPRAQHALELAWKGDRVASRRLLDELEGVVVWTAENSSDMHGEFLGRMIQGLRDALKNGAPVTLEQVTAGRNRTMTSIRHYLYVYLPKASMRKYMPGVDGDWLFAEKDPNNSRRRFLCLLCHEEHGGDLYNVRVHIGHYCIASTDSVRSRLECIPSKKDKRKIKHDGPAGGDPGAGPSSHGGGRGGGGGGGAPGASAAVGAA